MLNLPVSNKQNYGIGSSEYCPLYSIGFKAYTGCRVPDLINLEVPDTVFDEKYGRQGWKNSPPLINLIKKCIAEGLYNVPLLLTDGDSSTSIELIPAHICTRAKDWVLVTPSVINIGDTAILRSISVEGVFKDVRLLNTWARHPMRKTNKLDRITYITNLMFLASISDNSHISNSLAGDTYKPLFCMMVKRSDIRMVKAHFITNTPMPSSLMELWVDSSVEAEGSSLKPYFRKYIKSKLEVSGVKIQTFDNLGKEIIRKLKMPSFNILKDKEEWLDGMLDSFYGTKANTLAYKDDLLRPLSQSVIELIETSFGDELKALI